MVEGVTVVADRGRRQLWNYCKGGVAIGGVESIFGSGGEKFVTLGSAKRRDRNGGDASVGEGVDQ